VDYSNIRYIEENNVWGTGKAEKRKREAVTLPEAEDGEEAAAESEEADASSEEEGATAGMYTLDTLYHTIVFL
jgi:hypothetical protein